MNLTIRTKYVTNARPHIDEDFLVSFYYSLQLIAKRISFIPADWFLIKIATSTRACANGNIGLRNTHIRSASTIKGKTHYLSKGAPPCFDSVQKKKTPSRKLSPICFIINRREKELLNKHYILVKVCSSTFKISFLGFVFSLHVYTCS